MKEEILTAKEWLKEETLRDGIMTSKNKEKLMLSDLVEKYANYKNRILEDRVKELEEFKLKITMVENEMMLLKTSVKKK